eukprot:scaffold19453_cov61-Phaeocystis_antarctica.AAC.2
MPTHVRWNFGAVSPRRATQCPLPSGVWVGFLGSAAVVWRRVGAPARSLAMRGSDGCPRVLICSLSCKLHRCAPSTRWQSSGSLGSVIPSGGRLSLEGCELACSPLPATPRQLPPCKNHHLVVLGTRNSEYPGWRRRRRASASRRPTSAAVLRAALAAAHAGTP